VCVRALFSPCSEYVVKYCFMIIACYLPCSVVVERSVCDGRRRKSLRRRFQPRKVCWTSLGTRGDRTRWCGHRSTWTGKWRPATRRRLSRCVWVRVRGKCMFEGYTKCVDGVCVCCVMSVRLG